MMKYLLLIGAVLLAPAVYASDPIYVVDMQRVLDESISGKAAKKDLELDIKQAEAKLSGTKLELQKQREALVKQSALLSAEALEEKQNSLLKREREFQRTMKDSQSELKRKNDLAIGKVVVQAQKIIEQLAKEKSYNLVVERDRRLVLYSAPEFDLTTQVVKQLDKQKIDS